MGYLPKTITGLTIRAYMTRLGRKYLTQGNVEKHTITQFSLGDSDFNYKNNANPIENGDVPNISGDNLDCLLSLSANYRIKHNIKRVIDNDLDIFSPTLETTNGFVGNYRPFVEDSLSGVNLVYTIAERTTNLSHKDNHLFKTFNLPVTEDEKTAFDVKYKGTALESLNVDKILVIQIPENEYGESLDGKRIVLTIPRNGTPFKNVLYSTFFQDLTKTNETLDSSFSDTNDFSQDFGYLKTSLDPLNTNIAYLFCDGIKPPVGDANVNSWSYVESQPSFSTGKRKAVFQNVDGTKPCDTVGKIYDRCVGLVYLDKGFIVITEPDLITEETSGTKTKGLPLVLAKKKSDNTLWGTNPIFRDVYFDSVVNSNITYRSAVYEFVQSVTVSVMKNEFNFSKNPTFNPNVNQSLYITEFGLYNSDNELIAIAKTNEPVIKLANGNQIFLNIEIVL